MASDIESAIFAFLASQSTITSLLGSGSQGSIFPMRAPEGATLPVLVYHKVTGPLLHSKDGDMNLSNPHFQFTCWADKYAEAKAVIAQVRTALQAYTGPTLQGVAVSEIIVNDDGHDLMDPTSLEFGVALDAIFWHS